MNDNRRSAIAEERVASRAVSQADIVVRQFFGRLAGFVDAEVHHVASVVPFGILQTVLFPIGIEVWACGLEVRAVALGVLMKVDGVPARWQIMQVKVKSYACALRTGSAFP